MEARRILLALSLKNNGDWSNIYKDIVNKVEPKDVDIPKDCDYITILDDNYPDKLKHCFKTPFVLYYKGNINLLNANNRISLVYGRDPTSEFTKNIRNVFDSFDNVVIGNFGFGDMQIIRHSSHPIVVLPCGLDKKSDYVDFAVKMGCLVLSEYPSGVDMSETRCLERNRIIEGIAHKTLVLEMKKDSGNMSRVNFALQNGQEVYAVPYPLSETNVINNVLISDGANVCLSLSDLEK